MPITVVVTIPEAAALNEASVPGVDGVKFTYNPSKGPEVLANLNKDHEGYQPLAGRLANLASQFGHQDTFFVAPEPEDAEDEPVQIEWPKTTKPMVEVETFLAEAAPEPEPETETADHVEHQDDGE